MSHIRACAKININYAIVVGVAGAKKEMNFSNIKSLFFENKTLYQTIFKNTFWLMVAEVFTKIIGFFTVIWLARHYGPDAFGKFEYALSVASIFAIFVDFGFSTLIVREIARDKSKSAQYIANILAIKFVLSVVVFGLLALSTRFIGKDSETLYLIYFLGVFSLVVSLSVFFQAIFRAYEKMEYETLCRSLEAVVSLGLIAFFITNRGTITDISYAYVGGALIGLFMSLFFVWRYFSRFFTSIDVKICKEILKEAWPIAVVSIAVMIIYLADSFLLGFMRSSIEVGWYRAAAQIIFGISLLPSIFFYVFFPRLSEAFKNDSKNLNLIVEKYSFFIFSLAIPIGVGGVVLAPELIPFLYGGEYMNAILPFQILSWNSVLFFMIAFYGNSLWAFDKPKHFGRAVLIGMVFNIVANLVLIPKYGIISCSVVAVVTQIIILSMVMGEFNKIVKINIRKILFSAIIASVIMATLLFLIKYFIILNPILLILIGGLIYGAVFYYLFFGNILKWNS